MRLSRSVPLGKLGFLSATCAFTWACVGGQRPGTFTPVGPTRSAVAFGSPGLKPSAGTKALISPEPAPAFPVAPLAAAAPDPVAALLSAGVSFRPRPRRMLSAFAFPRNAVKEFKRPSKVVEDAGHFKS